MHTRPLVRLLEADPDLGRGLSPQDGAVAARQLLAGMLSLDADARPGVELHFEGRSDLVGLLVLSGIVARTVRAHGSTSVELLGPGDVLCPQVLDDDPGDGELTVLRPVRFAILDQALFTQVRLWPAVTANLLARTCARAHHLSVQLAISHMVGLERRILALLWHLAYRWGSVSGDGVVVPVRLTNRQLGGIVGACDPSVSTAVASLARQGRMRRKPRGIWLPLSDGPSHVHPGGPLRRPPTVDGARQR